MTVGAIEALARVIGYPDGVPSGAVAFTFMVDGVPVKATEESGRLVLVCALGRADETDLSLLAGYAAGRLIREDATLAYDPESESAILWQEVAATAGEAVLRRFFEVFMTSCDWWRARIQGTEHLSTIPEMVIRP